MKLKTDVRNEQICGTETSTTMLIPVSIPIHCFVQWAREQGLGSKVTNQT